MWRTIEISREKAHLAVEHGQLLVMYDGQSRRDLPMRQRIPCEDLGVLIVDHDECTYTHRALSALAESGAVLVVCDGRHIPTAALLPFSSHTEVVWRVRDQIALGAPLRKRLWAAIVAAKVRGQAANLDAGGARPQLLALAQRVRSGDPDNIEAQAARAYWQAFFPRSLLGRTFRREAGDREAEPPNNLLDYGYAIMRAAVARALVGAGLLPMLGIHHENRSNAFCLADDLVEPLRPLIDAAAKRLVCKGQLLLDQPTKAELLLVLTATVRVGDTVGPLNVALGRYVASLARCLAEGRAGSAKLLLIPEAVEGDGGADREEEGALCRT